MASIGQPTRTVGIVDDSVVVAMNLAALIELNDDVRCAWTAGTLQVGLDLVQQHPPDVLVLDLDLPEEVTRPALMTIRRTAPETLVVLLTASDETEEEFVALDAGAVLVRKGAGLGAVLTALRGLL